MNIKEAREQKKLTIMQVSKSLEIPYRTLQSWEHKERECPTYLEKLIVEKIIKGEITMNKKIRLITNSLTLTNKEYEKFEKGDTLWGNDENPQTIKKYDISEKETAEKELKTYKNTYEKIDNHYNITEYALEYYTEDEDGNFYEGSDFSFIS